MKFIFRGIDWLYSIWSTDLQISN